MGQPGKEQMLRGSAVLLSKALLASFCFALEKEMFCLSTTSPLPVSSIAFHDMSHLSPGVFSRFAQLSPAMSCATSFSPGHRFSCPFCAFGSEMSARKCWYPGVDY